MRVLVIEADGRSAGDMAEGLREFGIDCAVALSLPSADAALAAAELPDALVLDSALPRAMAWLSRKRRRQPVPPVLVLTAQGGLEGRVLGLNAGGDDYLVAPFTAAELAARLRILLRRFGWRPERPRIGATRPQLGERPALPARGGSGEIVVPPDPTRRRG